MHDHFEALHIEHAFGGALALAYYVEPRGTMDVDINVFLPFEQANEVVTALETLSFLPEQPAEDWSAASGVRLVRPAEVGHLDLFFSLDEHYDEIARRTRSFPFGAEQRELPFLSVEDLAIFKLSFGRDKDWMDLRQLARANPDLDFDYVERQLLGLRGPTMHPRLARFRRLLRGL